MNPIHFSAYALIVGGGGLVVNKGRARVRVDPVQGVATWGGRGGRYVATAALATSRGGREHRHLQCPLRRQRAFLVPCQRAVLGPLRRCPRVTRGEFLIPYPTLRRPQVRKLRLPRFAPDATGGG